MTRTARKRYDVKEPGRPRLLHPHGPLSPKTIRRTEAALQQGGLIVRGLYAHWRGFAMPKVPRNCRQSEAIRAFVRFGGEERKGKGSHRLVKMPNGHIVSLPSGIIKAGLLEAEIKKSGMTVEQFIDLL